MTHKERAERVIMMLNGNLTNEALTQKLIIDEFEDMMKEIKPFVDDYPAIRDAITKCDNYEFLINLTTLALSSLRKVYEAVQQQNQCLYVHKDRD